MPIEQPLYDEVVQTASCITGLNLGHADILQLQGPRYFGGMGLRRKSAGLWVDAAYFAAWPVRAEAVPRFVEAAGYPTLAIPGAIEVLQAQQRQGPGWWSG